MVYNVDFQNCFPKKTLCRNHEFFDFPLTTAYIPHPRIIPTFFRTEIRHIPHKSQHYGFLYTQVKSTHRYCIRYVLYCDSPNNRHCYTYKARFQSCYSFPQRREYAFHKSLPFPLNILIMFSPNCKLRRYYIPNRYDTSKNTVQPFSIFHFFPFL